VTDRTLTTAQHTHVTGAAVVTVTGELDHHTAQDLTQAIDETPFEAGTPVVLDLTGLTYCDSTGITVLVAAYNRGRQADAPVVFVGLNDDLMRVFHIVGLDQLFTFRPTVEEAISSLPA
jgi:anti-sigma B factor antagonist